MVLTGLEQRCTLVGMFERFTANARRVIVQAQDEAKRLQHNYIGTEHILLGLLGVPDGLACRALAGLGLSLEGTREEVTAIIGTGGMAPTGRIPFTPRAKKILELSLREALQLHHNYIGTEHILLGLIREGEGVGAQILAQHAELTAIRAAVLDQLRGAGIEAGRSRRWLRRRAGAEADVSGGPGEQSVLNATPAADATLSEAARLAGVQPVGSHHLLLAALADPDSAAARALARPRRRPRPGQGGAARRGRHGHQRRAGRGGGPAPDGHPGDRGAAHDRGQRSGHPRSRARCPPRAGRQGRAIRQHPR